MSLTHTASSAGGRRFWVTVFCFVIANCAVWVGYDRWQKAHKHHLLEVTQFTPGEGAMVEGRPAFTWLFNLDMAAPAPKDPPPGVVSPAIAGKWEWPDARTLRFTPESALPRATPIKLTLSAETLHTPDGFRLARPFVATLHTPVLEVVRVRQLAFDDADRAVLELTFNDKVIPADVQKHLSLRGNDGHEIHYHPQGDAAGKVVLIQTDSVSPLFAGQTAPAIDAKISSGLAGEAGPLGLAADFNTRVPLAADLLATEATVYYPRNSAENDAQIHVYFNNPVDVEALRHVLTVEPAVPITIVANNYNHSVRVTGAFQCGLRYAIKLAKPPVGMASKKLPRPTSLSVLIPDRGPGVWFDHSSGYLGSAGNRTVMAHLVNMTDVRVTVTRMYDNNLVAWRNASSPTYWQNTDAFSRPIATRDLHLPTKKNQTQDAPLSLDDLLPAGESRDGVYQITLSQRAANDASEHAAEDDDRSDDDEAGSRYGGPSTIVTLSDIALTAKQSRGCVTAWATSLRTARPLAGIHVRLYSGKGQLIGEAITAADGLAKIDLLPAGPGEKPAVLLADQDLGSEVHNDADAPIPDAPATADRARKAAAHLASNNALGRGLTWLDLRGSEVNFADADTTGRPYLRNGYEAFVYTDRGVYRPGETVHLRAIVRGPDNATPPRFPVRWQIRRPDLHDWKAQMAEIDADGATSFDLELPTDLPSGRWSAHVGLPGDTRTSSRFFGTVTFDVEDFMPQRMKVSVDLGKPGQLAEATHPAGPRKQGQPPISGGRLTVGDDPIPAHLQADYLFGRPVTGRPATLVARLDPTNFSPAGFREFTFGDSASAVDALGHGKPLGRRAELEATDLDDSGHATWNLNVDELITKGKVQLDHSKTGDNDDEKPAPESPNDPYVGPWRLTVTGSVTEAGGRAVTATRQVEVDRVPHYVGLHARDTAARQGVATAFDVRLVTPAGALESARTKIDFTLYRENWNSSWVYQKSRYRYQSTRVLEEVLKGSHDIDGGRGEFNLTPAAPGSYVLMARNHESHTLSSVAFYVGYGEWQDNISRQNPERLEVLVQPVADVGLIDATLAAIEKGDVPELLALAERAIVAPPAHAAADGAFCAGQRAQVIVRSPFAGRLLLAIETDGVLVTRVLEMPVNHIAVPIEIPEGCRPNAYVTATVVRAVDPNAAWTVHRAIGVTRLPIDNSDRKLAVELITPAKIRPTASLGVQVRVLDSGGKPVANAAVTVAAVDEGICQLTSFTTPDPFGYFTAKRALAVRDADLFGQLMPEVPKAARESSVGGDEGGRLHKGSPVNAKRVRPVALVSAVLHTDAAGMAHADFATPQFSGQLRVMAVASEDNRFGSADAPVLVRGPVLVQSSWPRFAAPTDRFTVPLTIFNNSPAAGEVNVTVELTDAQPLLQFAGKNPAKLSLAPLAIAAGAQGTIAFDIVAQDHIGVAHARLIATLNGESYEENIELPIRPGSPTVLDSGYAIAKPEAPATVAMPAGFVDGASKFDLRVSATPQLQLPQGLDYLDRYPYGCAEQTTSTLFPLVYLNDIGQQIAPGVFDKTRVAEKVQIGFLRLLSMQTSDGGVAMWPGERTAWPWASVYAAHFLVEAQAAGYDVPETLRDPLLAYVRNLLNQPEENGETVELQSYAVYVLALAGKPQRAVMARLSEVAKGDDTGSARFHLATAWIAAGRRDLAGALIPQVIPALRGSRELLGNLGSPIRDRAILISTLLAVDPQDPRIAPMVQQLAAAGRSQQWRSTQDVAFSVMAIGRYLRTTRLERPYETAELLLDGQRLAISEGGKPLVWFANSYVDSPVGGAKIPAAGKKLEIRITGPAGATAHVSWMESGVKLKPTANADNGLVLRRRYLDEKGKPLDAMRVQSGDLVQIELTLTSRTALNHVVIEDLLPAGLEIENPRLAGNAADLVVKPRHRARGHHDDADANMVAPAFTSIRTDMRDDRLILVGDLAGGSSGTYLYTARAVTPGHYMLPPARGECMYDLGVNSLWGGGTFDVLGGGGVKVAQANAR